MRWAELLREAVWPRRVICLCCGRPSRGGRLCGRCDEALGALRIAGPVCPICGHPLTEGACAFCDGTGVAELRAVWTHRDEARQLVLALKHGAVADAAQVLADGMADLARTLRLPPDTVVTWPTMPAGRRLERGIDHGELLAEAVGERLSLPVRRLLTRSDSVAVQTQVGMGRQERLTRLQEAFGCEETLRDPVLLVDDVLTTSATATVCVERLLNAGVASVTVVTATQAERVNHRNEKEVREDDLEKAADGAADGDAAAERLAG